MHICADLHCHSTASDGELTPAALVSLAAEAGLHTLALTDHDTVAGIDEAVQAAGRVGLHLIPGIELSARFEPGTLHILGYFSAPPRDLEPALAHIQEGRTQRLPRIIQCLQDLGFELTEEEVLREADGAQLGRPHVARVLLAKGYVRSFDEAFSLYLAKGRPAFVEKDRLNAFEALDLIHEHGGLSVLAHPFTLDLEPEALNDFVADLSDHGLGGIETYYSEHTRAQRKRYKALARHHDLVLTGGSDFHTPGRHRLGASGLDPALLARLHTALTTPPPLAAEA